MRPDNAGFFWDDTPVARVLKEKVKRTPPEPVWENADYLPGLAEANAFPVDQFTEEELIAAYIAGERMLFDVEVYPNYVCIGFTSFTTGKVLSLEMTDDMPMDLLRLRFMLTHFCLVGFNSKAYDEPICQLAAAGYGCAALQQATNLIILENERGQDVLRKFDVVPLSINGIDLIEVAPLRANLKLYGGRLHVLRMQDLPFKPGTSLTPNQQAITRYYNVNDLVSTGFMLHGLLKQVQLREQLSSEYGIDLRSKSDAQIAEGVISSQVNRLNGFRAKRPQIDIGTIYKYQPPAFLRYATPLLNRVLHAVATADFVVGEDGGIGLPQVIKELKLEINRSVYQMGIGGLHSSEQSRYYVADENHRLLDRDVTSYYPKLIINSGTYPPHLGPAFLQVYEQIVKRRVEAKERKDEVTAESLKITANGTFGKLGSPYSILYAPNLLIQVTLTGQLSLLMLIERMELAGIPVVSANTDGVVMHCPKALVPAYNAIIAQWEADTGLQTEETEYAGLYSRDVNNYMAVKLDGKIKAKGAYLNPWNDPKLAVFRFHKNPTNFICSDAVEAYLTKGTPAIQTIRACQDIRRFVTVRTVRGGAVKVWPKDEWDVGTVYGRTEYLGKSIRWYYATGIEGEIVYAMTGNKVPRSDGARPLMELPMAFPIDVDFDWYERETHSMLGALGLPGFKTNDEEET